MACGLDTVKLWPCLGALRLWLGDGVWSTASWGDVVIELVAIGFCDWCSLFNLNISRAGSAGEDIFCRCQIMQTRYPERDSHRCCTCMGGVNVGKSVRNVIATKCPVDTQTCQLLVDHSFLVLIPSHLRLDLSFVIFETETKPTFPGRKTSTVGGI